MPPSPSMRWILYRGPKFTSSPDVAPGAPATAHGPAVAMSAMEGLCGTVAGAGAAAAPAERGAGTMPANVSISPPGARPMPHRLHLEADSEFCVPHRGQVIWGGPSTGNTKCVAKLVGECCWIMRQLRSLFQRLEVIF